MYHNILSFFLYQMLNYCHKNNQVILKEFYFKMIIIIICILLLLQVPPPPDAGAFKPRVPKATSFRRFYERGDFPIALEFDTKGNKIAWKVIVLFKKIFFLYLLCDTISFPASRSTYLNAIIHMCVGANMSIWVCMYIVIVYMYAYMYVSVCGHRC